LKDLGRALRNDAHPAWSAAVLCAVTATGSVALGIRGSLDAAVDDLLAAEALRVILRTRDGVALVSTSLCAGRDSQVWVIGGLVVKNTAVDPVNPAAI